MGNKGSEQHHSFCKSFLHLSYFNTLSYSIYILYFYFRSCFIREEVSQRTLGCSILWVRVSIAFFLYFCCCLNECKITMHSCFDSIFCLYENSLIRRTVVASVVLLPSVPPVPRWPFARRHQQFVVPPNISRHTDPCTSFLPNSDRVLCACGSRTFQSRWKQSC